MEWIVLITGIFNIVLSLLTNTENVSSAILFKVIPFFTGLGCFYYGLQLTNIL
jgi:hypothetical protein